MARPYGRTECSVAGCDGGHLSKNYCSKHYQKYRLYGDPLAVVENRGRFKPGSRSWNKGVKFSEERKSRMNTDGLSLGHQLGELHHMWKGEEASYYAKHMWVSRRFGKPNECEHCYDANAKKYEWANISGEYIRDRKDWRRLCKTCHIIFDGSSYKSWEIRRDKIKSG